MTRFLSDTVLLLFSLFLVIPSGLPAKTKKPVHPTSGKHRTSARSRKKLSRASSLSWRNRQMAPSADRCREIQSALKTKGYLASEPSGTWDAESQNAMRRFQADKKIDQTGKVNSLSLIALGLGPAKQTSPAMPTPVQNK